jgi:molybdopterin/thiamine biosynthesis adenylyltransferase
MSERNSRQSFLGVEFHKFIEKEIVSIVGLGGGGSILTTELAHIGFKNFFLCDPDEFEESNINRLMGSVHRDIERRTDKVKIAERVIRDISPDANVFSMKGKWQDCIGDSSFKKSKIIFSGLDDFANRVQLESFARRNKIPLIDIGLTIKKVENYHMMGQVVLSHPEGPCFKCYQFITDRDLKEETDKYGDAGPRAQVIWANAILASAAIGLGISLISDWNKTKTVSFYKHLDGNDLSLKDNLGIELGKFDAKFKCPHFI